MAHGAEGGPWNKMKEHKKGLIGSKRKIYRIYDPKTKFKSCWDL